MAGRERAAALAGAVPAVAAAGPGPGQTLVLACYSGLGFCE